VVRQTTPDLIPFTGDATTSVALPTTSAVTVDASYSSVLVSEGSSAESSESPERIERNEIYTSLLEGLLPQIWEPRYLNSGQVSTIVNELCTFVPSMAYEGHTLFMHEGLYQTWQPPAYQDSVSLSALYMAKTHKNAKILACSIDHKISTMISASSRWTLTEHLAAVQAMIIYQIIRLFDPSLNQQPIGHKQNALLELWTATLWKRSFNEPPPFPATDAESCYRSWIFQESLRRTVLMSVFLRGAWSCVTKGGLCDQVPVLARLPLTRDVRLWGLESNEWMDSGICTAGEPDGGLVAYGDLSYSWKPEKDVDNLDAFERLLLAACRGDDDPRLLIDKAYGGGISLGMESGSSLPLNLDPALEGSQKQPTTSSA
jgi:hypothetical protein